MVALHTFTDQLSLTHFSSTRRLGKVLRFVVAPILLLLILFQAALYSHVAPSLSLARSLDHIQTRLTPGKTGADGTTFSEDGAVVEQEVLRGEGINARIGKVTAVYYDQVTKKSDAYEMALRSHRDHDRNFGYPHFVLRRGVVKGLWSKEAYLLSILVAEMEKPASQRLDWLFWHDADVVLTNSEMPLEIFTPPADKWSHVNYLVTNDLNGMNDGVFFLRVCEWSINFMAAGLAYRSFNPKVDLRYDEQTALELLSRHDQWKNGTMHAPQRWFNAYNDYGTDDSIPPEWKWTHGYHRPGDLLVHLPGSGDSRSDMIKEWLGRVQKDPEHYNQPISNMNLTSEIEYFWDEKAAKEEENQVIYWRKYHVLNQVGGKADREREKAVEEFEASAKEEGLSEKEVKKEVKAIEKEHKVWKMEALRKLYDDRLNGREADYTQAE
ncbi:hypothetical protein CAC42_4509 [Sphaceloma murrayae]|uniref:Glycosyltransferase family 34 protein n=1 Tax=Sphaceloma murrayae TaxID=2082308 RepID=A0A2K1QLS2_9PEZI|nr:hypothetical protein CAC42_4509 [Sphaceloma murrayae]